jgi:predicted SnoaL-like aldol condensation-catalyzing enzyme
MMSTVAGAPEAKNPKTGMTHAEMKEFIRNHFEEFVNRKNLQIGEVNFAPEFVDHGADVPPGMAPGPAGAIQYVRAALKNVPDLHVTIADMIAEDDKVVVRNHWVGTDAASKQRLEFSGIVTWRIAHRQIVERWAYLESPHPARN